MGVSLSPSRSLLLAAATLALLLKGGSMESNEKIIERVNEIDHRLESFIQLSQQKNVAIEKLLTALLDSVDKSKEASSHVVKRQAIAETPDGGLTNLINQLTIDDLRELIRGRDGNNGSPGLPGRDGLPGLPGRDGDDGEPGTPGRDGTPREEGNSGSVYTHWGRKTCVGNSTLIYEGFAASAAWNETGGGTNYQCLPFNPQEDQHNPPSTGSIISGAEYWVANFGPYPEVTNGQNVPCARCFSPRSALMMLPARSGCPAGWHTEYHGYLMSANIHNPHPATYECMDINPEYVAGQAGYNQGALFYFVKPDCGGSGSIGHCPPYRGDKKLLCSVCTK